MARNDFSAKTDLIFTTAPPFRLKHFPSLSPAVCIPGEHIIGGYVKPEF